MAQTQQKPKVATATQWTKAKRHYPTLPSGVRVGIEIPDIAELVASGSIPNELVDVAVQVAKGGSDGVDKAADKEAVEKAPALYRYLVTTMVKEPEVDDKLYDQLPTEDKEMLVAFATRQIDVDANYEHLGGLHKSERWRTFRGIPSSDEDLEGDEGLE